MFGRVVESNQFVRLSGIALLVLVGVAPASGTASAAANKCAGAKLKAAAKKLSVEAKCHAKALNGDASKLNACLTKIQEKFPKLFAKAESNPPCITTNDAGPIETKVDTAIADLLSALTPDNASGTCAGAKMKAAGTKVGKKIGCYAKATTKGTALDTECLAKADAKFTKDFAKAEGDTAPCPTTGDHDAIEQQMDAVMVDVVAELLFPASGFPGQWTEQGPGPATVSGFGYTQVSGAIQAIAADPTNPARLFVAAVNGGVWKTDNATNASPTWTPLTDGTASLSMKSIVFSPADGTHNTLYASFGGVSHGAPINGDNHGPLGGILKTTDGGDTWTELGQSAFLGQQVFRVVPSTISSPSGEVVFAAAVNIAFDGPGGGVYRSDDGGKTWQKKSGANGLPEFSYVDIVEDPGSPQRLYTAIDNPPRIFRSEDGGDSWVELTSGLGVPNNVYAPTKLAISPTADGLGRHRLYAVISAQLGIYTTIDAGATWTHLDQPPNGSHFSDEIVVSPSDPSTVFAASDSPAHWRGTVGSPGTGWYQVDGANAGGTAPHTDGRDWVFSANPNVMFESDDGGVYRLSAPFSASPSWTSAIGNIRVTEFLSIAYDDVNNVVFGACWDNSIPQQTTPDGIAWGLNEDFYGDGVQAAVDNTSIPGASVHYSSQQNFFRAKRRVYTSPTTVTQDTFLQIVINGTGGRHYNEVEGALGGFGTIRFIQPWTLNAVDGTRLLLGTDYLYESFDRGDHFNSLGGIGTNGTGDPIPLNPVGTVTACAYGHPQNADVLYVGTPGNVNGYRLWVRTSGTGYPSPVGNYPGLTPWDIALDPTDWQRAYVVDSTGHVWRTTDAGATAGGWSDVTTNLGLLSHDLRTIDAVADPGNPGRVAIVAGGYGGVFVALDDPAVSATPRWRRAGPFFSNAIVTDLHYDTADDLVIAGTYGRGAWKLPQARALLVLPIVP